MHTYTYIYINTHTHIHTYRHTYIHTNIHTYIHTYVVRTYIHTYIHIFIHTYGAAVWIKAMELESYKTKLIRVQRLINIKIAKAYRTVSTEALCILTGMTPIAIKIEEAAQIYQPTRGNTKGEEAQVDSHMEAKNWQHPVETIIRILEDTDEKSPIQIFTDGSKTEKRVGASLAIFKSGHHIKNLQCRLNKRCTNNQAEQLAILTALK